MIDPYTLAAFTSEAPAQMVGDFRNSGAPEAAETALTLDAMAAQFQATLAFTGDAREAMAEALTVLRWAPPVIEARGAKARRVSAKQQRRFRAVLDQYITQAQSHLGAAA